MGNSGYWPYSTFVFLVSGPMWTLSGAMCSSWAGGAGWGRGRRDPESLSRIIFCTWVPQDAVVFFVAGESDSAFPSYHNDRL